MIPLIRMLQIQNYKSLASVSVELDPLTVIVGPNGSGKSNFIDALAFVQECVSGPVEVALKKRGGIWQTLSKLESRPPIKLPHPVPEKRIMQEMLDASVDKVAAMGFRFVLNFHEDLEADYAFEIAPVDWYGFVVSRERCVIRSRGEESQLFQVRNGQFEIPVPGIAPQIVPDRLALFAAAAIDTFRPVYEFLSSMSFYSISPDALREPQDPDPGFHLKRDGGNAASVLRTVRTYYGAENGLYARINQLLANVLEGLVWVQDVSVGSKETLLFHQNVGLSEPVTFSTSSVSDGTLRVLGLLLAVYQPGIASVVGIEEPEATVHPAIAEMITEVLLDAANERQILITTHSPDILDHKELKDEQIRVALWKGGRTLIARVSAPDRLAIRERLYSPGELLRIGELDLDAEAAARAASAVDLFGEPFQVFGD